MQRSSPLLNLERFVSESGCRNRRRGMPFLPALVFIALIGAFGFSVRATPLELTSDDLVEADGSGMGRGRGIGFRADQSFSIDSIGLFGRLEQTTYEVLIFASSNGHDATSILFNTTAP